MRYSSSVTVLDVNCSLSSSIILSLPMTLLPRRGGAAPAASYARSQLSQKQSGVPFQRAFSGESLLKFINHSVPANDSSAPTWRCSSSSKLCKGYFNGSFLFLEGHSYLNTFGCAFPTSFLKRLCQPSTWLLEAALEDIPSRSW